MKGTASALKTHMAGSALTVAHCWKVTRTDGTVFGFTDHDQSLTISGTTYTPSSVFSASAVASRMLNPAAPRLLALEANCVR